MLMLPLAKLFQRGARHSRNDTRRRANDPRSLLNPRRLALGAVLLALMAVLATGCTSSDGDALAAYQAEEIATQQHIEAFDTLDFDVYSHQKWTGSTRATPPTSSSTGPTGTRRRASPSTSRT